MKKIKEEFKRLTNINPLLIVKLNKGITNKNYLVYTFKGVYVLRMPRNNMIGMDYANQKKVIDMVTNLNVDVIAYDNSKGILVTRYLKGKKEKVSSKDMVDLLKKLHSIDTTNINKFDPFKQIEVYKSLVDKTIFDNEKVVLENAKKLYDKYPLVLCHNDVLVENFINNKNTNYLIDYEYAGLNIELFDVASYLSENELDDSQKEEFLSLYYKDISSELLDDIKTMIAMLDILWSYWAIAMYKISNEQIFKDIADIKTNRTNNF